MLPLHTLLHQQWNTWSCVQTTQKLFQVSSLSCSPRFKAFQASFSSSSPSSLCLASQLGRTQSGLCEIQSPVEKELICPVGHLFTQTKRKTGEREKAKVRRGGGPTGLNHSDSREGWCWCRCHKNARLSLKVPHLGAMSTGWQFIRCLLSGIKEIHLPHRQLSYSQGTCEELNGNER